MPKIPLTNRAVDPHKQRAAMAEMLLRRCRSVLQTAIQEDCPLGGGDEARKRVLQRRIDEINKHHSEYR